MPTAPAGIVAMVDLNGGKRKLFWLKIMMGFIYLFIIVIIDLVLNWLVWSLVCDLGMSFVFLVWRLFWFRV